MGRILKGTPLNYGNPKQVVWVRTGAGDFACTAETEINSSEVTVVIQDNGTAHAFCESAPRLNYSRIVRKERGYPAIEVEELAGAVAVLYSVVVGAVREFWVKTKKYDRKVGEAREKRVMQVVLAATILSSPEDPGSGTGVITVDLVADPGTTVTPSSFSLTASLSVSGGVPNTIREFYYAAIDGPGDITANAFMQRSVTGRADVFFYTGFSVGLGGLMPPSYGRATVGSITGSDQAPDGGFSDPEEFSYVISDFFETSSVFLNKNYALMRAGSLGSLGLSEIDIFNFNTANDYVYFASRSISGAIVYIDATEGIEYTKVGAYLLFRSSENWKLYRIDDISGSTIRASLVEQAFVSAISSTFRAAILYPLAADITYGLHTVDGGTVLYTAPPLPVNMDDWRRALVSFGLPDAESLNPCLFDALYRPDAILESGKLYRIALDQTISGQTLRTLLETSPDTVTATLTTQTATSGVTCTLGTATESTVQVPSPGRGTIEGITYLP